MATTLHPELHIDVCGDSSDAVLRIGGQLEVRTAGELRRMLEVLIEAQPSSIVLELDAVTSIDAAGLIAVTAPVMKARRASIEVRIVAPDSPRARSFVDRVGVLPILNRDER